jgi:CRP-like cAMP-binding protein
MFALEKRASPEQTLHDGFGYGRPCLGCLFGDIGVVEVTREVGGTCIKTTCKAGTVSGEQLLLGEAPSDETAVALTACTCIAISRSSLHQALQPLIEEQRRETASFLLDHVRIDAHLQSRSDWGLKHCA